MLDTNIVSHFVRKQSEVDKRIVAVNMELLCISAITEGELLFGLVRRPANKTLAHEVDEFLTRVEVLPWNRAVARDYAALRAAQERTGKTLASIDLLIAAHAISAGATLVTNDAAFAQIPGLLTQDWTKP
jgi:tRNA(fMet)-specific endonuclease VapC